MAADLAFRNGAFPAPPATPPNVAEPEARAMSPPRKRPSDVEFDLPTETMPAIVPARVRSFVYVARELGLPYLAVAGIFAILAWLGMYVLQPQNQQSIDNQKGLLAQTKDLAATNAKWASIIETQMERDVQRDARLQPTIENQTAAIRDLQAEMKALRMDIREMKK